ncbi:uncharacterized protein C8A04DRAFT_30457 [Dichotomopilus funicola]|uniref:Uncharacterized protein n=1 Tax=Dichotomopilus funicola TaxID=1934379 RepID=A0AAN6ZJT6_9PEZI|nr:hypothetical protein C8A04DRAFT_30457 [Dichotomopilus funicola]
MDGAAAEASSNATSRTPLLPGLSINQLAARHPRQRLLVHPFFWTGRYLDLLGCRAHFDNEPDKSPSQRKRVEPSGPTSSKLEQYLAAALECQLDNNEYCTAIYRMFVSLGHRVSLNR